MPVPFCASVPTRAPPVEFNRSICIGAARVIDVHSQEVIPQAIRQFRFGDSEMLGQQAAHEPRVIRLCWKPVHRFAPERAQHALLPG